MSDDVVVKIRVDNSDFKKKVNETQSQMNNFGSVVNSAMKKVASAVAVGFAVQKVTQFGSALVKTGIQFNAMKEQSMTTWTTLLGSQEEAIKQLDRIQQFAAKTPFSQMGVDTMAKYLHNANFEGDAVFDMLTKIGDMGSAFGVQEDSLVEMTRQFSQVQQAGYAYTEDLNILADRGIPIYQAIADTVGVTVAEVKKMASEGKLTADIYNKAIDSMAENTKGAMDAQSQTFSGVMSTMSDTVTKLSGLLTEYLFKALKEVAVKVLEVVDTFTQAYESTGSFKEALKQTLEHFGLDKWAELITKVEETFKWIKDLTTEFFSNKDAMFAVGLVLATLTTAIIAFNWATILANASMLLQEGILNAMIIAETIATGVTTAFGVAMAFLTSPITLVIGAIALLIAGLYALVTNWEEVKKWAIDCWNGIVNAWNGACEWFNTTIIEPLKEDWDEFWTGVTQWATDTWNGIVDAWNGACTWFKDTIVEPLKKSWNEFWTGVTQWATDSWTGIVNAWNSACAWFTNTIVNPLTTAWNTFWNGVKTWASDSWTSIKGVWNGVCSWFTNTIVNPVSKMFSGLWQGIADFLKNPLESVKSMFKSAFNWIADKMNIVIDGLNKFQVPEGIPIVGGIGINIPRVPKLWKGTNFAKGGMTLVGEQGPELVNLNRGASVLPAHKTRSVLNGGLDVESTSGVVVSVGQLVVREEADVRRVAEELYRMQERNRRRLGVTF